MKKTASHPDTLVRLSAGRIYLGLVRKEITCRGSLVAFVQEDLQSITRMLGSRPDSLIDSPLDVFEKTASVLWFPLQKSVAAQMSVTRTMDRENFVSRELIAEHRDAFEPGDIVLERRNWFMSNAGIPGFWPHVALVIGTPAQLDRTFKGIPALAGTSASEVIAKRFPAAWRKLNTRDKEGFPYSILEALRPGIILTSLEESANADYLAVLRPRVSREDKFKAVQAALSHYGKPYDFDFDFATDNELVCSELVHKAYLDVEGVSFEPVV
ncbi:unnamed protein product, partial [marine sediment metagenome]